MTIRLGRKSRSHQHIATRAELAVALDTPLAQIAEFVSNPSSQYGYIQIPKSDGGIRQLRPPRKKLRAVQRNLLDLLYKRLRIPAYLHGGIPGRSIVTHAERHVGMDMVGTLDVKDFFPSTGESAVSHVLLEADIHDMAMSDVLGLSMLDGGLPQGSPVSSLLANLAFCGVDQRIRRICRRRQLNYSRYVDDIAVSGAGDFAELKGPFTECIVGGGYAVAPNKVLFQSSATRQIITGLVVNDKLRPTRAFICELKHSIRLCIERGAPWVALSEGIRVADLKARLNGRMSHVRQCDRALGERIRKLLFGVDWAETLVDPVDD